MDENKYLVVLVSPANIRMKSWTCPDLERVREVLEKVEFDHWDCGTNVEVQISLIG